MKDKETGHAVDAGFEIFWVDDDHQWLSASARSDFRFLIPSARDVSLRLSADGYKTLSVPLRFEPGQHKVLNLELGPTTALGRLLRSSATERTALDRPSTPVRSGQQLGWREITENHFAERAIRKKKTEAWSHLRI